jgi:hypothetical protein
MYSWSTAAVIFSGVVVAMTFAASAVGKARDLPGFHQAVGAFALVPAGRVRLVASVLFGAEVVTVLLLVAGLLPGAAATVPIGLALGGLLLVAYTVGLVTVQVRKMQVTCHCFGASPVPVSWYDVARNVLLLAVAVTGVVAGVPADRPALADSVLVALFGVAAALIITNLATVVATAVRAGGTE